MNSVYLKIYKINFVVIRDIIVYYYTLAASVRTGTRHLSLFNNCNLFGDTPVGIVYVYW